MSWSSKYQDELRELHLFVDLCLSGLQTGTEATHLLEQHREVARVLRRPDPFPSEEHYLKVKDQTSRLESFAREQQSLGFSYLFALTTIKLWTSLETMVDNLARQILIPPFTGIDPKINNL